MNTTAEAGRPAGKLETARGAGWCQGRRQTRQEGYSVAASALDALRPRHLRRFGALVKVPARPESSYGDGVVTGHGLVNRPARRRVLHDQTVYGGSVGEMFGRKVCYLMEWAGNSAAYRRHQRLRSGARIQGCRVPLAWYGEMAQHR